MRCTLTRRFTQTRQPSRIVSYKIRIEELRRDLPLLLGAFTILWSSVRDQAIQCLRTGVDVSGPRLGARLRNADSVTPSNRYREYTTKTE